MSNKITFLISGKAYGVMEGSELTSNAVKYDGGSQGAHDALAALRDAPIRKAGRGYSLVVTVSVEGARVIKKYCETVGETFVSGGFDDVEAAAEGRALLKVAERIQKELTTP